LKYVVCVKQIYDIASNITVNQGRIKWAGDSPPIINPWDEFAVEAALLQKEQSDGEVIAISVGDENAREALKHALAMGCDSAIWVQVDNPDAFDSQSLAAVLAAAVQKVGSVDAVFFGRQASDTEMGVMAVQTARKLNWPAVTLISSISKIDGAFKRLTAERSMEEGRQTVEIQLPAVLSINKDIGEPRFPSFLGTRKAAKAVIPVWSLADLSIAAPDPVITNIDISVAPQRRSSLEMLDGATPDEIAQKLVNRVMDEKIL
jgi:electron transfer flavoprotein beta subunit